MAAEKQGARLRQPLTPISYAKATEIKRLHRSRGYACLREAPPAKALCGGQALRRRQGEAGISEGKKLIER